jgi:hypothetical protein
VRTTLGSADACCSGTLLPLAPDSSPASYRPPIGRGVLPTIGVLVVGLIVTFVGAAFVRDRQVGERRTLVAQVSAEYVEALNGQLIRSIEALYAIHGSEEPADHEHEALNEHPGQPGLPALDRIAGR